MGISEKVAYLKGLAEGLKLDAESNEGKLFSAIIDVLDDMAEKFADIEDELCDVEDGLDAVSDDLSEVEESLYELEDEDEDEWDDDEDEEDCFMTTCPECEEEVYFDESILEDGEVVCPNFMDLEVTETEPGLAGNTATNTLKPATVETGAEVKVPLFINIGDKITIDTRTGEYLSRCK